MGRITSTGSVTFKDKSCETKNKSEKIIDNSIPASSDDLYKVVRNRAIDGIQLIDDGSPIICDSREFAKRTSQTHPERVRYVPGQVFRRLGSY